MKTVNVMILTEWSKGKQSPSLELAFKAEIAVGTVNKVFKGVSPSKKVRVKIASAIGVDEDLLFPSKGNDLAA